jgi:hypothetical protein
MEFFRNQFVVQVDRSHGWQSFRVISTRDRIRKMIASLTKALEQPESELRPSYLTKDAPTPLWQGYVTQAFRRSDRKVLTVEIVPDPEKYHTWQGKDAGDLSRTTFYILAIGLPLCTIVGAGFLLFHFFNWLTG